MKLPTSPTLAERIKADNAKREKAKQESRGLLGGIKNAGRVISEGLLSPNEYNAPAANRFKDSAFGLLGIVPGVGDAASAAESADLFNRGENFAGSLAALGALPLVPAFAGMVKQGGKAADALVDAARQPTKYELAHQTAQQNAVDMLGLPPGNTAMDRAKEMGYKSAKDVNSDAPGDYWFHGTPAGKLDEFYAGSGQRNLTDNNNVGSVFTTNAPGEADFYAKGGEYGGSIKQSIERGESPTIYPLLISGKYRRNPGKNYVGDGNVANFSTRGSEKEWAVPAQTNQIRSIFAAFDPARSDSADLLAGVAPYAIPVAGAGLLGAAMMPDEAIADDKKKNKKNKNK